MPPQRRPTIWAKLVADKFPALPLPGEYFCLPGELSHTRCFNHNGETECASGSLFASVAVADICPKWAAIQLEPHCPTRASAFIPCHEPLRRGLAWSSIRVGITCRRANEATASADCIVSAAMSSFQQEMRFSAYPPA